MLIKKKIIIGIVFSLLFLLHLSAFSQDIEAKIKISSDPNSKLKIEGKFLQKQNLLEKNWSFLQSYADAEDLGKRINDLRLFDEKGIEIIHKKFAEGEFVAERSAESFSYNADVKVLPELLLNTHISWVDKTHGLLMLNDLFPIFTEENISIKISFDLPPNWKVSTSEEMVKANTFYAKELQNAVFVIGENWRGKEIQVDETKFNFVIFDEWQFQDNVAYEMAEEITKEYADLFGEIPFKKAQFVLMNFPEKFERNRWRAETRGTNVTILSSQTFSESSAKQRLHEQLRHEIFHLWIPNSLDLSGDYAWFYEGFAIYQALKTGVWLGQIGFNDYLDTLEQAYFLSQKRSVDNSLLDISKMRWNVDVSSVYANGLLVAFMCDAAILEKSKGKRDIKDIFREIYKNHRKPNNKKDANTTILKILQEYDELAPIVQRYIKGKEKIDWTKYLYVFGIENNGNKFTADLKVKSKLSGREKALLKKLGYNRRRNFIEQKVNRNVN